MSNQRGTFAKRRREQALKDKARDKKERLAARRAEAQAAKLLPVDAADAVQGDIVTNDTPSDAPSTATSDDAPGG
jgi:hypothetical protein